MQFDPERAHNGSYANAMKTPSYGTDNRYKAPKKRTAYTSTATRDNTAASSPQVPSFTAPKQRKLSDMSGREVRDLFMSSSPQKRVPDHVRMRQSILEKPAAKRQGFSAADARAAVMEEATRRRAATIGDYHRRAGRSLAARNTFQGAPVRDGVVMSPGKLGGNFPMTAREKQLNDIERMREAILGAPRTIDNATLDGYTSAATLDFGGKNLTGGDVDAIMRARFENPGARSDTERSARNQQLREEQAKRIAIRAGLYQPGATYEMTPDGGIMVNGNAFAVDQTPAALGRQALRDEAALKADDPVRQGRIARAAMRDSIRERRRQKQSEAQIMRAAVMGNPAALAMVRDKSRTEAQMMRDAVMSQARKYSDDARLRGIQDTNQTNLDIGRAANANAMDVAGFNADRADSRQDRADKNKMAQIEAENKSRLALVEAQAKAERNLVSLKEELRNSDPTRAAKIKAEIADAERVVAESNLAVAASEEKLRKIKDSKPTGKIHDDVIKGRKEGLTPDEAERRAIAMNPGEEIPLSARVGNVGYRDTGIVPNTVDGANLYADAILGAANVGSSSLFGHDKKSYSDVNESLFANENPAALMLKYTDNGGTEAALREARDAAMKGAEEGSSKELARATLFNYMLGGKPIDTTAINKKKEDIREKMRRMPFNGELPYPSVY